jgi:hypothetical protein
MVSKNRKEVVKRYYLRNREKILKYKKEWFLKNKEEVNKKVKKWCLKNKERITNKKREWCLKNKEKLKTYRKKWQKERLKQNPNFKLSRYLRTRIYLALKGVDKSKKTMDLIGTDYASLWDHLEKTFKLGMTKENYGKWHIDHIIPCNKFDLKCPVQQIACFHYSNLQALWAKENIIKRDKILPPENII